MSETHENRGQARPGAIHKTAGDDEELQRALEEAWPGEERVRSLRVLAGRATAGDFRAIALLLAYAYGKPSAKAGKGEGS